MDLVDKQQDFSVLHHLRDHLLDSLLELTAVLGSRNHAGEIQNHHTFSADRIRNVAGSDELGEAFDHSCFSHTRFSDETRVIFCSSAQDLDHAADLFFPADDRIQFSLFREDCEITTVSIQCRGGTLSAPCLASLRQIFFPGISIFTHRRQKINVDLLDVDIQRI